MKTILFQGDSITDAGRNFNDPNCLGPGYVGLVGAELEYENPQDYKIYNRGISGNRVVDLYARWKIDCLNLKPDILTILIGVNDVWHEIDNHNGVDAEKFEKIYRMLIDETLQALPDIKIILMEPYVKKGPATEAHIDYFAAEVAKRQEAVRRIAADYGFMLVPLQSVFDEADEKAPTLWWTGDGVHPTRAGHEMIAKTWKQYFDKIEK